MNPLEKYVQKSGIKSAQQFLFERELADDALRILITFKIRVIF